MGKLTPKQESFVKKFIECGNEYEACRYIYNVGRDIKPETLSFEAGRLLTDPNVRARLTSFYRDQNSKPKIEVGICLLYTSDAADE